MTELALSAGARSTRTSSKEDHETRARLLNAAAPLFAEHGFERVTVRDICLKAHANVAAVNYHFGGKDGLYTAVMESAIDVMSSTTELAREAGKHQSPEDKLRTYITVFVQRVTGSGRDTWIHQLLMRELADPTPALDLVVERVLKPRMDYLCAMIAELTGREPEDPVVVRCGLSVQTQFHAVLWNQVLPKPASGVDTSPEALAAVAEHITQFSLAGVREFRKSP
jgi:AcrR family transcriptional regulator